MLASSRTSPIRRIVVAMSGGVDSAVAAALLQRRSKRYDVIGVHMENWDEQDENGECRIMRERDVADAKDVCAQLGIRFTTVSFVKEYWNNVFSTLISDYEIGFTPNPDILCNRFIKFESFFKYAKQVWDADYIATGHYAQTEFIKGRGQETRKARLLRALDATKDQTLFLSGVHQEALIDTLFPLGGMYKTQVRRLASELGMKALAKKRDSVGICFIGSRPFADFISEYVPNRPGPFVELETGNVIGSHNGVHHWTIGQRCRIPGRRHSWYVAARDPETQAIYAVNERDHPALYSNVFLSEEPHWICDIPEFTEDDPFLCMFKFQHTEWTTPALLYKVEQDNMSDGDIGTTRGKVKLKVWLSISTRAVTPGQVAVFYKGNVCLGSAKIVWVNVLSQLGLKPPFQIDENLLQIFNPSHDEQVAVNSRYVL